MKGMARKLTGDCDNSHREEIANMFKHVWASMKVCDEEKGDGLLNMITQRGLSLSPPAPEPNFDLNKHEARDKDFCRIQGI